MKLKYLFCEKLSKFEAFLVLKQKNEESNEARDVIEKNKVETKLEDLHKDIQNNIEALEKELKAQENRDNVYDLDQKKRYVNY